VEKFTKVLIKAKTAAPENMTRASTVAEVWQMIKDTLKQFCQLNKVSRSDNRDQLLSRVLKFLHLDSTQVRESSQRPNALGEGSVLAYPKFASQDLAYKFKSFFYFSCLEASKKRDIDCELLIRDIKNIAMH
jgi:hypothetical protein